MTYGFDDVTFTSIGTGVAETQLNSATSLSAPDPAHAFNAVIPYQMELGAFTTNQSLLTAFRIQSDDVAVFQISILAMDLLHPYKHQLF